MKNWFVRDLSWLSFNERVLQEAADSNMPLPERIKFLGIFSNNLDEFFRVRVATLKRMIEIGNKANVWAEQNPKKTLEEIHEKVILLQQSFEKIWSQIQRDLKKQNVFLINERQLTAQQKKFVLDFFNEEIRGHIVPLMIESIRDFPVLNDKSIYLACTLSMKDRSIPERYALISVPSRRINRFIILPSPKGKHHIILLDDVIRFCLPHIFKFFGYNQFSAHAIKVTRDAEIDIDNDVSTNLIQKIEKGIKNRKKGKPVRLVFDKEIPVPLLTYLVKRLGLSHRDNLIPGGKIHNFKDFMDFPTSVFRPNKKRKLPFTHSRLMQTNSISQEILKGDILLHFPYHSFNSIIDLFREAAIDPAVREIKLTCYRLASRSKIINALTNAVRNGKKVVVVIELKARFDEEANLMWKQELEDAGVNVLIGLPNMKVHAKICSIHRKVGNKSNYYGFVSTGNLNEKTSRIYADHCLLTSNPIILADINRIFHVLEKPQDRMHELDGCKKLVTSPTNMRVVFSELIQKEIKHAKSGKQASITLKLNSLSDQALIEQLSKAAMAGVEVRLIIRSICCMPTENNRFLKPIKAISIVDQYLEHARVMVFHNNGDEKVFLSSADWMVRNLDHRIECACPVLDKSLKKELIDILNIQLNDQAKARIIDNMQQNRYVGMSNSQKKRSQEATHQYLLIPDSH